MARPTADNRVREILQKVQFLPVVPNFAYSIVVSTSGLRVVEVRFLLEYGNVKPHLKT